MLKMPKITKKKRNDKSILNYEEIPEILEYESECEDINEYIISEIDSIEKLIEFGQKYGEMKLKHKSKRTRDEEYYIELQSKVYDLIPALIKLNNMIGMKRLKERILRQIKFFVQGLHKKEKEGLLLHSVITGPPGHGKTELAKILGDIYRRLGFLDNDKFVTASADQLIAGYVGQTAIKTRKMLETAIGGVIFIDEIYSLSNGCTQGEGVGFAKECIDTINQFLYENKGLIVCIVAGYEEDIKSRFFSLNSGLERRFPFIYNIEPYESDELLLIFKGQVYKTQWHIEVKDMSKIIELFQQKSKILTNGGGDTENLLTLSKMAHSDRVFQDTNKHNKFRLTYDDIKHAFKELENRKNLNNEIVKDNVPFGMYC